MIQYGYRERVLSSHAIWLCVSCMTCGTRCPNKVDMSTIIDTLREMAMESEYAHKVEKNVVLIHEEFIRSIPPPVTRVPPRELEEKPTIDQTVSPELRQLNPERPEDQFST